MLIACYQGIGFKPDIREPEVTLEGKDLVGLSLSRDRILGLSSSGKVYSIPVSAEDQEGMFLAYNLLLGHFARR